MSLFVLTSVVLGNLLYLIGAVALIIVGSVAVVVYHHRPRSIESHVDSFSRGLRALAPGTPPRQRRWRRSSQPQAVGRPTPGRVALPSGARPPDTTRPQITVRRVAQPPQAAQTTTTEAEAG